MNVDLTNWKWKDIPDSKFKTDLKIRSCPKMKFIEQDIRVFVPGKEKLYRRLSVRECARIQTFPNDFIFHYKKVLG